MVCQWKFLHLWLTVPLESYTVHVGNHMLISDTFDFKVVCIFAANASSLPALTPAQLKKLRHLTIVSLAAKSKVTRNSSCLNSSQNLTAFFCCIIKLLSVSSTCRHCWNVKTMFSHQQKLSQALVGPQVEEGRRLFMLTAGRLFTFSTSHRTYDKPVCQNSLEIILSTTCSYYTCIS